MALHETITYRPALEGLAIDAQGENFLDIEVGQVRRRLLERLAVEVQGEDFLDIFSLFLFFSFPFSFLSVSFPFPLAFPVYTIVPWYTLHLPTNPRNHHIYRNYQSFPIILDIPSTGRSEIVSTHD